MNDLIQQAQSLLGNGEFNLAREIFNRVLKSEPKETISRVEAHLGLGLCDKAQNQLSTAAHHFEKAVEIYPNVASVENLIEVYSAMGEIEKQVNAAKKGLLLAYVPSSLKAKYLTLVSSAGNA